METLQNAYGLRERLQTIAVRCGALRCIMVHCGNVAEALWTTETLPNHCGSLQRIVVKVADAAAECITQTSIHLPYHPANPQKLIANP